jgi:hypothetical protein
MCVVFQGRRENAIDGSFIAEARCVKKWFELGAVWVCEVEGWGMAMRASFCTVPNIDVGFVLDEESIHIAGG